MQIRFLRVGGISSFEWIFFFLHPTSEISLKWRRRPHTIVTDTRLDSFLIVLSLSRPISNRKSSPRDSIAERWKENFNLFSVCFWVGNSSKFDDVVCLCYLGFVCFHKKKSFQEMKLLWINKYKIVLSSSSAKRAPFSRSYFPFNWTQIRFEKCSRFFSSFRRRRKTIEDYERSLSGRCAPHTPPREEISFTKTKESVYGWIIIMESSETCRSTAFFNSHCDSKRHSVISWLRGMRLMLWLLTLYSERATLTETETVRSTQGKALKHKSVTRWELGDYLLSS